MPAYINYCCHGAESYYFKMWHSVCKNYIAELCSWGLTVQVSNRRCRSLKGGKGLCWARIWQNDLSATALVVVVEVRFASWIYGKWEFDLIDPRLRIIHPYINIKIMPCSKGTKAMERTVHGYFFLFFLYFFAYPIRRAQSQIPIKAFGCFYKKKA